MGKHQQKQNGNYLPTKLPYEFRETPCPADMSQNSVHILVCPSLICSQVTRSRVAHVHDKHQNRQTSVSKIVWININVIHDTMLDFSIQL